MIYLLFYVNADFRYFIIQRILFSYFSLILKLFYWSKNTRKNQCPRFSRLKDNVGSEKAGQRGFRDWSWDWLDCSGIPGMGPPKRQLSGCGVWFLYRLWETIWPNIYSESDHSDLVISLFIILVFLYVLLFYCAYCFIGFTVFLCFSAMKVLLF